jgi:hypothetical protein
MGFAHHCVYLSFHSYMILEIRQYPKVTVTAVAYIRFVLSVLVLAQTSRIHTDKSNMVGGPGVKPGFAASDAAVLFGYTTHPLDLAPGIQPGSLR